MPGKPQRLYHLIPPYSYPCWLYRFVTLLSPSRTEASDGLSIHVREGLLRMPYADIAGIAAIGDYPKVMSGKR